MDTTNLDYDEIVFPRLGIDIHVNSTAFTIFGLEIQWYGILITSALFIAVIWAMRTFKRVGINSERALDAILFGVIGGIVGARAYYVIWKWDDYKNNLIEIFDTRAGGLAFYGGFIGALVVGLIAAKIRKLRILPLLDVVGPGFLFGQAVGRWGNFFNQEAFGKNTNSLFGMTGGRIQMWIEEQHNPDLISTEPVHPCFLYESTWCLIGCILLLIVFYKFRKFDGEIFAMYIGWYGLGRSFIESLRTDSLYIGQFKVSQMLAIIFVFLALVALFLGFRHVHAMNGNYKLYKDTEESKKLLAELDKDNDKDNNSN